MSDAEYGLAVALVIALDRTVRLALAAGRYRRERDEALEAVARVLALVDRQGSEDAWVSCASVRRALSAEAHPTADAGEAAGGQEAADG